MQKKQLNTYKVVLIASFCSLLLYLFFFGQHAIGFLPRLHLARSDKVSKALVMASYNGQDIEWTNQLPDDWEVARYMLDDNSINRNYTVPRNQGREAMAYITYIIDEYDNLPDYVVFVHGHERSWHQPEPMQMMVRALNLTAVDHEGYVSFHCSSKSGCLPENGMNIGQPEIDDWRPWSHLLPGFWETVFPGVDKPSLLQCPCCAQFAVPRSAIRKRPLEWWINLRKPMERDLVEFQSQWGEELDGYTIGILYEKIWHIIFGKPAQFCPSEDYCKHTLFSGAIECDPFSGDVGEDASNLRCLTVFDMNTTDSRKAYIWNDKFLANNGT